MFLLTKRALLVLVCRWGIRGPGRLRSPKTSGLQKAEPVFPSLLGAGSKVRVPTRFMHWKPNPQQDGIWRWGGLWEVIRSWGWGPHKWVSDPLRRDPRDLSLYLCPQPPVSWRRQWGHQHLHLGFQSLGLWEILSVCSGISYAAQARTRGSPCS